VQRGLILPKSKIKRQNKSQILFDNTKEII
jgi:hypothetical protein